MAAQVGDRLSGKVKWFSDAKGYGFISPSDGGEDLFVHHSDIHSDGFRTLPNDALVEFTFEYGDDAKPKAVDVTGPNRSTFRPSSSGYRRSSNGAGAGAGVCYTCNKPGHLARDCAEIPSRGGRIADGTCYECGKPGHLARNCRERDAFYAPGSGGGSEGCYNCGGTGHFARECPSSGGGGGGGFRRGGGGSGNRGACFTCGFEGHLARDCPNDSGFGIEIGRGGGGGRSGGACYTCGVEGHLAKDCPNGLENNGGGVGGRRSGGGRLRRFNSSDEGCYNCGKPDHFARDCPEPRV